MKKNYRTILFLFLFSILVFSCNADFGLLGSLDESLDEEYKVSVLFYLEGDFPNSPIVIEKKFVQGSLLQEKDFPKDGDEEITVEGFKISEPWMVKNSGSTQISSNGNGIPQVYVPLKDQGTLEFFTHMEPLKSAQYTIKLLGNYNYPLLEYSLDGRVNSLPYFSSEKIQEINSFISDKNYEIDETMLSSELNSVINEDGSSVYNIKCRLNGPEVITVTVSFIKMSNSVRLFDLNTINDGWTLTNNSGLPTSAENNAEYCTKTFILGSEVLYSDIPHTRWNTDDSYAMSVGFELLFYGYALDDQLHSALLVQSTTDIDGINKLKSLEILNGDFTATRDMKFFEAVYNSNISLD